jgi:hypothetical protein
MRHLDPDWREFFDALAVYKRLSLRARSEFLVNGPYSAPLAAHLVGASLSEYLENGVFSYTAGGRTLAVAPQFRGFVKAMRAMQRSRIDVQPNARSLDAYMADNFTREEWQALQGRSGYWTPGAREGLYGKLATVKWLEGFLNADPQHWEAQYRFRLEPDHLDEKSDAEELKRLVKFLMAQTEPVLFEQLPGVFFDREVLARAIGVGLRFALFYPMLRRDTFEPLLGLWPEIAKRLHRAAAKPPQPAAPVHTFHSPIIADEMIAALAAAIAEPLRLKAGYSTELFQKSERQIHARFMPLPDWLTRLLQYNDLRVQHAIGRLKELEMLDDAGDDGGNRWIEVTKAGRAWLGMPAKERLKSLLDRFRHHQKQRGYQYSYLNYFGELAEDVQIRGEQVDSAKAVREAFGRLPEGRHVRLKDFLAYESAAHNPLQVVHDQKGFRRISIGHHYLDEPTEEQLEQAWSRVLMGAIVRKLVPLGALEAGVMEDGEVTIAVTDAGRYLFGLTDDLTLQGAEAPGAVVVQPNFEIVFMAPSPLAEAELGSFTERHGNNVGAVLKITKKAVWAAAAAGITPAFVIDALRAHSSVPVPANVEREIRGWMAQCRSAAVRPALLIHCPDPETASRVLSADRTRLTKVTDTVVELTDPGYRSKLAKKLREIGVFI